MKGINHRLCKSMSRRNSQCHGVVAGARLSSKNSEDPRVRGTETESERRDRAGEGRIRVS